MIQVTTDQKGVLDLIWLTKIRCGICENAALFMLLCLNEPQSQQTREHWCFQQQSWSEIKV